MDVIIPPSESDHNFYSSFFHSAEAHRIGIMNHVVPKGQALPKAKEMIQVYDKRTPLSLAFVKRAAQ
ncbi:MAG: hypothetical protein O7G88_14385 [bacterium]|nr:hypothetical protein [bacterium]